jgi:hypothetical protein
MDSGEYGTSHKDTFYISYPLALRLSQVFSSEFFEKQLLSSDIGKQVPKAAWKRSNISREINSKFDTLNIVVVMGRIPSVKNNSNWRFKKASQPFCFFH